MKRTEKKVVIDLLKELTKQVQSLDDDEFESLLNGSARAEIIINPKVKAKEAVKKVRLTDSQMPEIRTALESIKTREEGHELLKDKCETKEDLTRFARYLDLPVQKSDKINQIFERIIEATIGYRIRSAAIQGHKR